MHFLLCELPILCPIFIGLYFCFQFLEALYTLEMLALCDINWKYIFFPVYNFYAFFLSLVMRTDFIYVPRMSVFFYIQEDFKMAFVPLLTISDLSLWKTNYAFWDIFDRVELGLFLTSCSPGCTSFLFPLPLQSMLCLWRFYKNLAFPFFSYTSPHVQHSHLGSLWIIKIFFNSFFLTKERLFLGQLFFFYFIPQKIQLRVLHHKTFSKFKKCK